ncbi:MAG: HD domain-containing protein [Spongiibacteraceae bacterium]
MKTHAQYLPMPEITTRFAAALSLAVEAHGGQYRKGTNIPYIAHPLAVASLVLRYGGDEDLAVAALLHDAIEDGGARYAFLIRDNFGARVSHVVEGCTDGVPNMAGIKSPWRTRKENYLARLRDVDQDVLLVVGCDKLTNASDILDDFRAIGPAVFSRFSVPRHETLWYYRQVTEVLAERGSPLAVRLREVVAKIEGISARIDGISSIGQDTQNIFLRTSDA